MGARETMAGPGWRVAVIMENESDWETMRLSSEMLTHLGIAHECRVLSVHRALGAVETYVREAESRGVRVFIAGAGGAAHLPGILASMTAWPVLGVPLQGRTFQGMDALVSMVQMPQGTPVGTLAIGQAGAANAALLAAAMLALGDPVLANRIREYRDTQTQAVLADSLDDES